MYKGSLNTEHLNSEPIQNQNVLKISIGMVRTIVVLETQVGVQKVPTIQKQNHSPTKQLWTIQNINMFGIWAHTKIKKIDSNLDSMNSQ